MNTTIVKNNTPNAVISVPTFTTNIKMIVIETATGLINLSNIEFYSNTAMTNKIFVCMGHFGESVQAFLEDGTSNCAEDGLSAVAASELKEYGGFSEYKFIDPDLNSFGHTDQDHRVMFWNTNGLKINGMRIKNRADGYHDRINNLRITFYTGFDGTQRIDQTKRLAIADRVMLVPAPDTNKVAATIQFESNFPHISAEGAEFIFKLVPLPASTTPSSSPSLSPSATTTPATTSSSASTTLPSTSAPPKTTSAAASTSSSAATTTTTATTPATTSATATNLLKAIAGTATTIPATLAASVSPKPGDNTIIYAVVGVLGASVIVAGGAFMYLRSTKGKK